MFQILPQIIPKMFPERCEVGLPNKASGLEGKVLQVDKYAMDISGT